MTVHTRAVVGPSLAQVPDVDLAALVEELGSLVEQDSGAASQRLAPVVTEAARRGLREIEAQAAYLRARSEVDLGHLTTALDLIEHARSTWVEAGDPLSALRTSLGRMHVLDDLGRHADAVAVGESLLADLDEHAAADQDAEPVAWLRAAALENIGVGRGFMGHHTQALAAYAAAEQTYRDLDRDDEVPRPLANRGVELIELGRLDEAVAALREAASGFATHASRISVGKCLAYEARAHLRSGDYLAAAAATRRSHTHLEGQATTTEYARAQLVRAETLVSLNLHEEALELYDEIVPRFTAAGLRRDLADARYGRALVLGRRERVREALAELDAAAESYAAIGAPVMVAVTRLATSELIAPTAACELVVEVVEVLRSARRPVELAAALVRLAQLTTDPRLADACLTEATEALDTHDIPNVRWRAHHHRGRMLAEAGRLDEARTAFTAATHVIERLRRTLSEERHRLFFMADRNIVLEDMIALELAAGDVTAAHAAAERARARTLVERLDGARPADVRVSSTALDGVYSDLLVAGASSDLHTRARRLERQLPVSPTPARITDPRSHRQPPLRSTSRVVVTYECIRDEVLAFVHRDDELAVVRELATAADIRDLVAQLDAQWRRFEDPGIVARQRAHLLAVATDLLQQLHLRLLSPLSLPPDAADLLVVPAGPVGNVPFAALHDGGTHVLASTTVRMAPSLAVAGVTEARSRDSFDRRLIVGVADEQAPLVVDEAREVAAVGSRATVLLDDEATVARVRHEMTVHDVVHVACHGIHRPDSPAFSALRLGDRWVTSAEVAGFELDGQLVVLSACSSGRQLGAGTADELVGLPRAFLAAGAGAVVVNLWQVDDASSRALMTRFHRGLAAHGPAAALRLAQLDLRRELPHPYHWAPAVVFGGGATAPTRRKDIS